MNDLQSDYPDTNDETSIDIPEIDLDEGDETSIDIPEVGLDEGDETSIYIPEVDLDEDDKTNIDTPEIDSDARTFENIPDSESEDALRSILIAVASENIPTDNPSLSDNNNFRPADHVGGNEKFENETPPESEAHIDRQDDAKLYRGSNKECL